MIETLLKLIQISLLLAGMLSTLLGAFVLFRALVLPKKSPMDKSNRLNHLRLVWFALNAPHQFVKLYYYSPSGTYERAFPWLTRDEGDNVDGAG